MANNKVIYGNTTIMDITDTTAEESDVVQGKTFYKRNGERAVGTGDYMNKVSNPTADDILITDANGQAVDSGININDVAMSSDLPEQATDNTYGLSKTNSAEGITLDQNGRLNVGGRLGQFPSTTGIYSPKTISPAMVKNGSLLLTEASGTSLGAKSLAVSTGTNITLKQNASAGATQYVVANTYQNRIICAGAVGGVVALNEASSATKTVNIVSVKINDADFVPDSSANDNTNNIIITTDESINPSSSISQIRVYANEGKSGGFSNLFVGQGVGGEGGASVIVGQKVFSKSGNACAMIGADLFNTGNGNAVFGRQHISRKNRWFMTGTGHDNTNGKSESGAVFGEYALISSDTLFAIGNGTSHTDRSNAFEIKTNGDIYKNGVKVL